MPWWNDRSNSSRDSDAPDDSEASVGSGRETLDRYRSATVLDSRENSWDPLKHYMAALRDLPPLPQERIMELAKDIREQERLFREALYQVPGTALLLLDRWNQRRLERRVTGLLSHHFRDEPDTDWSVFIDERLEALSRLVSRRGDLGPESSTERRDALDAEIARILASADVLFEVLNEIFLELCGFSELTPSRAISARKRRLGLSSQRARNALRRAEHALERRKRARTIIASHNLRFVVHVAKQYRRHSVPFSDLIQEGCLGLMRALDKFDASLGFRFSTYAVWWIEQAMIRAIQKSSRTVRVPSHVHDANLRFRSSQQSLRARVGEPSRAELADDLDMTEEQIDLLTSSAKPILSLERSLDDSDGIPLGDRLPDTREPAPDEQLDLARMSAVLKQALLRLKPRERQILVWRFGLKGNAELTLQEVGDRLGLSRERVRQIQDEVLARLGRQPSVSGLRKAFASEPEDADSETSR